MATHDLPFHQRYIQRIRGIEEIISCAQGAGIGDWDVILKSGFVQAVGTVMLDQHFCGFKEDELASLAQDSDHLAIYKLVCRSKSQAQPQLTLLTIVGCHIGIHDADL